jgi:6-pyruvoyltetrahydropterin/6-carboxytetrahydropterin synthase
VGAGGEGLGHEGGIAGAHAPGGYGRGPRVLRAAGPSPVEAAALVLSGVVDPRTGFIADLGEVEQRCLALRERLDHRYLNEIDGLEVPSPENIAVWIWKNLKPGCPALARVEVRCESCRHGCVYAGN